MTKEQRRIMRFAAIPLVIVAPVGVLYGLLGLPLMAGAAALDPSLPWLLQAIHAGAGGVIALAGAGVGVAGLVAAVGLWRGRRWAWLVGLACGALWAISGCAPLGVIVVGLLLLAGMPRDEG